MKFLKSSKTIAILFTATALLVIWILISQTTHSPPSQVAKTNETPIAQSTRNRQTSPSHSRNSDKSARNSETNSQSNLNPQHRHVGLPTPFHEIPKKQVLAMNQNMVPLFDYSSAKSLLHLPVKSEKDGRSRIYDNILPWIAAGSIAHRYSDGPEYLYFWGNHSLTPKRGFAVRKHDGDIMAWALNNDHFWNSPDKQILTTDRRLKLEYFFDPEGDRAEIEEARKEQIVQEEKGFKVFMEAVRESSRKKRAAELEATRKKKESQ